MNRNASADPDLVRMASSASAKLAAEEEAAGGCAKAK